jgi:hypothetical protein
MKIVTTTKGNVLIGRPAELYSGDCAPERPCTQQQIEEFRASEDGQSAAAQPHSSQPIYPRRSLWRTLGQYVTFAQAMARWVAAGRPVTPPEELAKRQTSCRGCVYFDHEKIGCKFCGCGTEGGSLEYKWLMATEECSADEPRWGACLPKNEP